MQVHPEEANSDPLSGPNENRTVRDVLFIVLMLGYMAGMGYVSYIGITNGNPYSLFYGTDSWGNICSQQNEAIKGSNLSGLDMRTKPYIFYFDKDILKDVASGHYLDSTSKAICVSECPNETLSSVEEMQEFANGTNSMLCQYDVPVSQYYSADPNSTDTCPTLPIEETTEIFFRCIPQSLTSVLDKFGDVVNSVFNLFDNDFTEKSYADLQTYWKEILYISSASLVISFIIIQLLTYTAGIAVWTVYILMILGSIGGIAFCWYTYFTQSKTQTWLIISIVVSVVGVLLLLILLFMRKQIALAVQLFKESGKAIRKMPILHIQPFITFIVRSGTAAGLVYIFLYLLTSKETALNENNGHVTKIEDPKMNYLLAYYVLGFLWMMEFILGCERMLISGAVVRWYFLRNKDDVKSPILKSYKTMIRYHLGSIAFGSLLIAIVQLIRIIVAFIDARLRGAKNVVAQVLLKILGCCLWLFEKFLKFLNANAYIEIAIHGYGFCKAAKSAMSVIIRNVLRVAAVNSVASFLLFIGKLATVAVVAVIGLEVFKNKELNYLWLPITLACIISYIIASSFLSLYEMAIDALFICFIEDCDMNDGSAKKPYFMSAQLMKYVDDSKGKNNDVPAKKEVKE
ncbi:hypothetical protein LOTGIDRAFT_237969 [Lottia gigantea]|uniref:Choline transporter-like protein n=1 Tax=Lottia gigantea TaxID=225164 RepID=V4B9Z8_LOTGI|nr:hypothetical protein LOTGIDRAFT_237969 [Lottia gigantea]ESP02472.1 hypothetical protein LOTGIDRAFT_237969 [Lottia gigantea]